eukprot:jgi/Orpsp1_1/1192309/evm.model.d7180000092167.1
MRYFDVFGDKYDNESHSNHQNIRYKGKDDEIKDTERMMKYVLKEDEYPLSNFDFNSELAELEKENKTGKKFGGLTQEDIRERIRENEDWYKEYYLRFINYSALIKNEFPIRIKEVSKPDFSRPFYIPSSLLEYVKYFENWRLNPFDRPKGLWLTGKAKSAKASFVIFLGFLCGIWPNLKKIVKGIVLTIKTWSLNVLKILDGLKGLLVLKKTKIDNNDSYFDDKNLRESIDKDLWMKDLEELSNMTNLKVYEIIKNIPMNETLITTRWVKRDSNSKIIERKARLVARGFTQEPSTDFINTFAPTLKHDSLRLFTQIPVNMNFQIKQINVNSANLNAPLTEETYLKAPKGYAGYKKCFWRLNKAIYGLRQSANAWNKKIILDEATSKYEVHLIDKRANICDSWSALKCAAWHAIIGICASAIVINPMAYAPCLGGSGSVAYKYWKEC